uniref:Uncharacterized protein n=1 Tax=Romanomermis culicivorax TaxID=13658 RepID=A0A915JF39_ROMCU
MATMFRTRGRFFRRSVECRRMDGDFIGKNFAKIMHYAKIDIIYATPKGERSARRIDDSHQNFGCDDRRDRPDDHSRSCRSNYRSLLGNCSHNDEARNDCTPVTTSIHLIVHLVIRTVVITATDVFTSSSNHHAGIVAKISTTTVAIIIIIRSTATALLLVFTFEAVDRRTLLKVGASTRTPVAVTTNFVVVATIVRTAKTSLVISVFDDDASRVIVLLGLTLCVDVMVRDVNRRRNFGKFHFDEKSSQTK